MIHVPWQERYAIHYQEVDQEHQELLGILNQLVDLVGQKVAPEQVTEIFGHLCRYAIQHFTSEERFLKASGYPKLAQQEAEHAWFVNRIVELDRSYDPGDPLLVETTMAFLKDWFVGHIMNSDQDYAQWVKDFFARAKIRGVIFDFAGVIARVDSSMTMERLAAVCHVPAELLSRRFEEAAPLFTGFECGAIGPAQCLEEISRICGYRFTEPEIVPILTEIYTPIPSTCELIRLLKPRYRLGLLANTNPWQFQGGIQTFKVFPLFDAVILSFQVKAVKPERRVFQAVLDPLDLVAEECVFIDASPAFVAAGNRYLLHGIEYRGYPALLRDLRLLGVDY